jgi:hypothetical protein
MTYYLTNIKDSIGGYFIGLEITNSNIEPYINELKEILGEDDFKKYSDLQQKRDRGRYHLTLINAMEYGRLLKEMGIDNFINSTDLIFKYEIDDLKMLGVGTATKNENRSYFIVCQSDKLNSVRKRYGLDDKDLHITLGFLHKDTFGVRKNELLKKEGKFKKLLRQEFYKKDNWNFIKRISNFDLDVKSDLIPIEIAENHMKLKCDGYYIGVAFMEEGEEFRIVYKYSIDEDLPRLPETEIAKILKNK